MAGTPTKQLETFANPELARDYTIRMQIPEFTTLDLEYVPDRLCVELKSLKLYIWSFRDRGAFHEAVTNEIADHLDAALQARFLRLTARFNVRGGIYTTVVAERRQPNWQPAPQIGMP